ncbi:DUF1648 domain-containing protein [Rossellomorea marisflavi]|uniref:DUF1648 domain-containing protein n=1 Tax=Rossellomorea marisflavi TaxID=189381 RepID=UPI0032E449CC
MGGNRPKLSIAKTTREKLWDLVGAGSYAGMIGLLVMTWTSLPDKVPAHYNLTEITRWGSKYELLILPAIGFVLGLSMHLLEKFPEVHNYPDRLNESNARAFYLNSRQMLNVMKNTCVLVFALLAFETVALAMGWVKGMFEWFLPVVLIGMMVPIVEAILKRRKIT